MASKLHFLIIYNRHLSHLLWHDEAKGGPLVSSRRQTWGRWMNWKSVVNEVREEEKKGAGSKSTCARQNLSPGQIGKQGPHCSPAATTAPQANDSNQICVIGLKKATRAKEAPFTQEGTQESIQKSTIPLLICTVAVHMTDYLPTTAALGKAHTSPISALKYYQQKRRDKT